MIALEYHDVIVTADFDSSGFPGAAAASYKLPLDAFRAHLDALARGSRKAGADARKVLTGNSDGDVLLTFDDGGVSALDVIAPELERRGWCGHFFIATDCIGEPGFLDEAQLRELAARGHVVGSHSRTHPLRMSSLPAVQLRDEWHSSITHLAEILGAPADVASVPGGAMSRMVAESARDAGARILFTSEPTTRLTHAGSCAIVGRYTLRRTHDARTVESLTSAGPSARAGQWLSWNAKKLAKRLGGERYLALRRRLFER